MGHNVIFGVDFKRSNPKADRAFWLGPDETLTVTEPIATDTAPSEYVAPDEDCARPEGGLSPTRKDG